MGRHNEPAIAARHSTNVRPLYPSKATHYCGAPRAAAIVWLVGYGICFLTECA